MELQSVHMVNYYHCTRWYNHNTLLTQRLAIIIDPYHNIQKNLKCCDISGAQDVQILYFDIMPQHIMLKIWKRPDSS